jgi:hypothetical protein
MQATARLEVPGNVSAFPMETKYKASQSAGVLRSHDSRCENLGKLEYFFSPSPRVSCPSTLCIPFFASTKACIGVLKIRYVWTPGCLRKSLRDENLEVVAENAKCATRFRVQSLAYFLSMSVRDNTHNIYRFFRTILFINIITL